MYGWKWSKGLTASIQPAKTKKDTRMRNITAAVATDLFFITMGCQPVAVKCILLWIAPCPLFHSIIIVLGLCCFLLLHSMITLLQSLISKPSFKKKSSLWLQQLALLKLNVTAFRCAQSSCILVISSIEPTSYLHIYKKTQYIFKREPNSTVKVPRTSINYICWCFCIYIYVRSNQLGKLWFLDSKVKFTWHVSSHSHDLLPDAWIACRGFHNSKKKIRVQAKLHACLGLKPRARD